MKKLFLYVAMLFILPHVSFAALITEDFDSYTADVDLNGGASGFGWAGNWVTLAANEVITSNAPAGMLEKAMKMLWISDDAGGGSRAITPIDPTTSGEFIVSFQMMAEQTNKPGRFGVHETGIVSRSFIRFDSDGNIHSVGVIDSILQPYTANQVYRILIKIGHVPGKFAVSIDGGAYSADQTLGGSSPYTISGVSFADETLSVANFWIDDISITTPAPPTITTLNRLAKFITGTTIGDALFSDDGTNTTLTSGNLFLQIGALIDTVASGILNFGTTMASAINIGRIGVTTTLPGTVVVGTMSTTSNCNSAFSPAACASAPAGSVALATGDTALVVNTSAVTANSQIFIQEDSFLGVRLGITCNTDAKRSYTISARTPGVSFSVESSKAPIGSKACLSYWVVN